MNFDELCVKVLADPVTKAKLAAALRRVSMNGTDYVSMTDSISLRKWICQLYGLTISDFDGIYVWQLKKLGYEILHEELIGDADKKLYD